MSIYMSLTLLVMISLCLTLIEGARRSCCRLETECAADIGLNSIMAEYHRELFRQYDLFYIDSSYGTPVPSYCNTQARLEYYVEQNLNSREDESLVYKDFLGLELLDASIHEVAFATDENGKRFQKRAAQIMLDEVGIGYIEDILEWIGIVEEHKLTEFDLEEEREQVQREIREVVGEESVGRDFWMPMDYISMLSGQGLLINLIHSDRISNQTVDLSTHISMRKSSGALNSGNASDSVSVSLTERILFHEYIMNHAGYWGQEKEGSFLKYQIEYVLHGADSDKENLINIWTKLFLIRGAANVIHIYSDYVKMGAVKAVAAVATAVIPELEPVVEAALVLGWAYVESLYDMKVLVAGGKVPLLKSSADWHYDLDSILYSVDMEVEGENQRGLQYKDYLHILLYLTNSQKLTYRFMDLMEMDIRTTEGNAEFRMDGCIEWLSIQASVRSRMGYVHSVQAQIAYE